jgi:hypothetical protein
VDSQLVPWTGRVILGVNLDSNSLAAIPNLDQSNRDKLSAYQTPVGNRGQMTFPSNTEVQEILVRELPHFGKWLLDYTPDPRVLGDSRYGVRSYFHPNIERAARDNSPRQQILEVIEMFIKELLASDPKRELWTGSSAQLMGEMSEMPLLRIFGNSRNSISFQRDLASAEEYSNSHPEVRRIRSRSTGSGKMWTIHLQDGPDQG